MFSLRSSLLYGIFLFLCVSIVTIAYPQLTYGQSDDSLPRSEYFVGVVEEVVTEKKLATEEKYIQTVRVKLVDSDEQATVQYGDDMQALEKSQRLTPGEKVLVVKQPLYGGGSELVIADKYRLPVLWWLLGGLVAVVFVVGRWRGMGAFAGMLVSLGILVWFVVPHILSGENPLLVTVLGSLGIGTVTLYLSHGLSIKTHISLISLYLVLGLVCALTLMSVFVGHFVGMGSEEALFLRAGSTATINLQGLFIGGVILGALGVLDDIIVAQVAVVFQLKAAQKNIQLPELYSRGLFVGKEHVASLVNTLALAYAGANLPLFLLFMLNKYTPTWVIFNSEAIAEEVVRTLVGSIGLVAAVPLTTLIAAVVATRLSTATLHKITEDHQHIH
ncbi:YibE/F family protein [Candidatus Woesebacteria bacterium]|nr:YibE/F family protein [Candidatus Woesebacteria bacterium]